MRVIAVLVGSVALTVLLAGPALSLSLNLLLNGDFEQPYLPSWAQPYSGNGITGWNIPSGTVDIVATDYWLSFSGRQSIDLDGISSGTIEQAFTTLPGATYWLSFAYSDNCYAPSPPSADVQIFGLGGSSLLSVGLSHDGSAPSAMNYSLFMASFVADGLESQLRFASTDAFCCTGMVFDAVGVYTTPTLPEPNPVPPVPEPSTSRLLGLALLGTAGALCLGRWMGRC